MSAQKISRRGFVAAATVVAAGLAGCGAVEDTVGSVSGGDQPEIRDGAGSSEGPGEPADQVGVRPEAQPELSAVEQVLSRMTLEQKVAQLFIVTPEQLTGAAQATIAGPMTRDALARIPVGGLCYFAQNIVSEWQLRDLLAGTRELACAVGAGVAPFLTIDEEGGPLVARVANSGCFNVRTFPNMSEIGASGDAARAAEVGQVIGSYLHDIGFNVDFAPDADVLTLSLIHI